MRVVNRTYERATTPGTGDIVLSGPISGFRAIGASYADGETFPYEMTDPVAYDYEIGIGTYHLASNSFTRTQVFESSNANGPVNWRGSAGTAVSVQAVAQSFGWTVDPAVGALAAQSLLGNPNPVSAAPSPVRLTAEFALQGGSLRSGTFAQAATGRFFAGLGAKVQRLNDRLFLGDATKNNGNDLAGQTDWLGALMQWPVYGAQAAITSSVGQIALTLGSRASDLSASYNSIQTTIGLASFAVNDTTARTLSAYALYAEARRYPNVNGTAFGFEVDAINFGAAVGTPTPYLPLFGGGTVGIWAASGGGQTGVQDAMAAYVVKANGAKFNTGLLFAADAISGTDGVTGYGQAVALAKGHMIKWYSSTGGNSAQQAGYITSDSTAGTAPSVHFVDTGLLLLGPDGQTNLSVRSATGQTRYLMLQAAAGMTAPGVYATGPEVAVNLGLYPKGNGQIETSAPVQAAAGTGGGSTIPARAATFMQIVVNGTTYCLPLFPVS